MWTRLKRKAASIFTMTYARWISTVRVLTFNSGDDLVDAAAHHALQDLLFALGEPVVTALELASLRVVASLRGIEHDGACRWCRTSRLCVFVFCLVFWCCFV